MRCKTDSREELCLYIYRMNGEVLTFWQTEALWLTLTHRKRTKVGKMHARSWRKSWTIRSNRKSPGSSCSSRHISSSCFLFSPLRSLRSASSQSSLGFLCCVFSFLIQIFLLQILALLNPSIRPNSSFSKFNPVLFLPIFRWLHLKSLFYSILSVWIDFSLFLHFAECSLLTSLFSSGKPSVFFTLFQGSCPSLSTQSLILLRR